MPEQYFPEEAVACLRRSRHDPGAKPGLELISGSFIWDDEFEGYWEFVAHCRAPGLPASLGTNRVPQVGNPRQGR